eukprot:scaffold18816_cov32-Tisochrysis_lutea.AAC.2
MRWQTRIYGRVARDYDLSCCRDLSHTLNSGAKWKSQTGGDLAQMDESPRSRRSGKMPRLRLTSARKHAWKRHEMNGRKDVSLTLGEATGCHLELGRVNRQAAAAC